MVRSGQDCGSWLHDLKLRSPVAPCGFRKLMQSDANRDRFVRCFIAKLLTYANGEEPKDRSEIERILKMSAEHEYRIVDTIVAVIDSALIREG